MVIRVGINGFGRIGRVIFRTCLQNPEIELSAINDPAIDIDYICYLIKFDSTHGKFKGTVTHTENEIKIDDRTIKVFREKLPPNVPWHTAGVQYVVEASGMFTCLGKASGHLASDGVRRVIVTAPSVDVPMVILGVNDNTLNTDQKVLSCASSTLYCLAPMVKILEDTFGVTEGFITSIHAMTPSLKPLDGLCLRGKHWRDHRSIHQNIIPASTGACKALAKIIPQVKDKMSGLAFRVPIVNVSVLDLTIRLNKNTTIQDIIKSVENASNTYLRNIVKISNDEAVSSDFIGDSHSCILDADSSLQLKPDFFKLICWYENEYSYACRVLDSIFFSEKQFCRPTRPPCKMTYVRAKFTKKQDEVQQTDRNMKEMSMECSYAEVPKVLCSTSQDTALKQTKPASRPLLLKKPLSLHNSSTNPTNTRDTKKRNEIFKIWNDSNEAPKNVSRHNRSSFFHSCVEFPPQSPEKTECIKAQERLENVKKEFSKMVNITEDLLKKSYNNNKIQLESSANSSSEGVKVNSQSSGKLRVGSYEGPKTLIKEKSCSKQSSNPIFKICGDFKNRNVISSTNHSSKEEVRCYDTNDNISDYSMAAEVKRVNSPGSKKSLRSTQEETCMGKQNLNTNSSQHKNTFTLGNLNVNSSQYKNSYTMENLNVNSSQLKNTTALEHVNVNSDQHRNNSASENLNVNSSQHKNTSAIDNLNVNSSHHRNTTALENVNVNSSQKRNTSASENLNVNSSQHKNTSALENLNVNSSHHRNTTALENVNVNSSQHRNTSASENLNVNSNQHKNTSALENLNVNSSHHRNTTALESVNVNSSQHRNNSASENFDVNSSQHKNTSALENLNINSSHHRNTTVFENVNVNSSQHKNNSASEKLNVNSSKLKNTSALENLNVNSIHHRNTTVLENLNVNSSNYKNTSALGNLNVNSSQHKNTSALENLNFDSSHHRNTTALENFNVKSSNHKNTSALGNLNVNSSQHKNTSALKNFNFDSSHHRNNTALENFNVKSRNHKNTSALGNLNVSSSQNKNTSALKNLNIDSSHHRNNTALENFNVDSSQHKNTYALGNLNINSNQQNSSALEDFYFNSSHYRNNTALEIDPPKSRTNSPNARIDYKKQTIKPATSLKAGITKNLQVQSVMNDRIGFNQSPPDIIKTNVNDTESEEVVIKIKESSKSVDIPCETIACDSQTSKSKLNIEEPQENINLNEFSKYLLKKDHNMQLIDEELKKRNIVLVNTQKELDSETNLKSCSFESARSSIDFDDRRKNTNLHRHFYDNLNRYKQDSMVQIPDDISQCSPENTATTISNGEGKQRKPDLYDKLDSASATDSNNSFEINERKSQVIHITDLTNSLEDLARLDKICRIIEISDELSDKLFSPLDKTDTSNPQQKKWSFRDLCDRIQLDEFCNKVFGKTS